MALRTPMDDEQAGPTTTAIAERLRPLRPSDDESLTGHRALIVLGVERLGAITAAMSSDAAHALLATLTARLYATIAPGGLLLRIGPDDFAIASAHLREQKHAVSLAGQLVEAVSPLIVADGVEVFLKAHAGVAFAAVAVGTERLLGSAYAALVRAQLRPHEAVAVYDVSG